MIFQQRVIGGSRFSRINFACERIVTGPGNFQVIREFGIFIDICVLDLLASQVFHFPEVGALQMSFQQFRIL